jgi:hypothetical protein
MDSHERVMGRWHARGQGFESPYLHLQKSLIIRFPLAGFKSAISRNSTYSLATQGFSKKSSRRATPGNVLFDTAARLLSDASIFPTSAITSASI